MRTVLAVILSFVMLAVNGPHCSSGDGHHLHGDKTIATHMADMTPYGSCDPLSGLCDMARQASSLGLVAVTAGGPTTQPLLSSHRANAYWAALHLHAVSVPVHSPPVKDTSVPLSTPVTRHTVLRI